MTWIRAWEPRAATALIDMRLGALQRLAITISLAALGALLIGLAVPRVGLSASIGVMVALIGALALPLVLNRVDGAIKVFFVAISVYYFLETVMTFRLGMPVELISVLSRWQLLLLVAIGLRSVQLRGRPHLTRSPLDLAMIAFATWTLLYFPTAPSPLAGLYGVSSLLQFQVAYWCGRIAFADVLDSANFLFWLATALAAFGILQPVILGEQFYLSTANHVSATYAQDTGSGLPRAASLLGSEGYFGSYLMVVLSLALARLMELKSDLAGSVWERRARLLVVVVLGAGLVASFHRSSWAAAGIAFVTVVVFARKRLSTGFLTLLVTVAGLLLAQQFFHVAEVVGQVLSSQDFSANSHISNAEDYFNQAAQHPFGLGLGAAGSTVAFLGDSVAPGIEGGYSQVVLQLGVIGLAFFVVLHVLGAAILLRRGRGRLDLSERWAMIGAAAGILGVLCFNLFLPFQSFNPALLILWLFVGAATTQSMIPAKEATPIIATRKAASEMPVVLSVRRPRPVPLRPEGRPG